MELALNADGSLTLGADIMARLGAAPGQRVAVTPTERGMSITAANDGITLPESGDDRDGIDALQEFMESQSRALDNGTHASIEDIQHAIERGYVAHGMRGLQ